MTQEQLVIIARIPAGTNIKKFAILYQGPRVWNCLPACINNLSSFSTFKNKVLEFFIKIGSELGSVALLRSPYLI